VHQPRIAQWFRALTGVSGKSFEAGSNYLEFLRDCEKVINFAALALINPAIQMTQPPTHELTQLLIAWSDGDRAALDKLTPLVYEELRRLARRYMSREGKGHTLQTTALVHEAYLRLFNRQSVQWQNRAHFFAIAAQLMRCILVDHARGHACQKRGGKAQMVSLDEAAVISQDRASEVIALDEALKGLAAIDPQQSRIVELRFFGGLSVDETAEVLSLSAATIKREWSSAKLWLHREISKRDGL
jgi:RNA polymerase sigma-70 factor (ECF subfamily)